MIAEIVEKEHDIIICDGRYSSISNGQTSGWNSSSIGIVVIVHVNTTSKIHVIKIFSSGTNTMRVLLALFWDVLQTHTIVVLAWYTQGLARAHRVSASVVDTRLGTRYNEIDEPCTKTTHLRSICAKYTKNRARFQCFIRHTANFTCCT